MKLNLILAYLLHVSPSIIAAETSTPRYLINAFQQNRYELVVTQADLDKAPLWLDGDDNPPLAARAAVRIAQDYIRQIPNSGEWRLSSIVLERSGQRKGQWIYIIQFTPYEKDKVLGAGNTFKVPILLNGSTVELRKAAIR